jgi:hypothetical protein
MIYKAIQTAKKQLSGTLQNAFLFSKLTFDSAKTNWTGEYT